MWTFSTRLGTITNIPHMEILCPHCLAFFFSKQVFWLCSCTSFRVRNTNSTALSKFGISILLLDCLFACVEFQRGRKRMHSISVSVFICVCICVGICNHGIVIIRVLPVWTQNSLVLKTCFHGRWLQKFHVFCWSMLPLKAWLQWCTSSSGQRQQRKPRQLWKNI